jgi:hypothetical protein
VIGQPDFGESAPRDSIIRLDVAQGGEESSLLELSREEQLALASHTSVMKNYVGMSLDYAIEDFEARGGRARAWDASSEKRSIYVDSNWTVVEQDEPAGSLYKKFVGFSVLKTDEPMSKAIPIEIDPYMVKWETQWYGTITGNTAGTSIFGAGMNQIEIDGSDYELDLINTFSSSCADYVDDSQAQTEKERLLPIGAIVRVVMSDSISSDKVVVHRLETDDLTKPFEGSVNEGLVASGYWVPDYSLSDSDVEFKPKSKYKLDRDSYIGAIAMLYGERIVAAANLARSTRTGGVATCIKQAAKYQREARRAAARYKAWIDKANRERPIYIYRGGGGSCADGSRDGDGDGICNEG